MAETKLANLVNPEVMADMISAQLPAQIKFSPLAKIDTTLEGRPGNTISVPKYAYIGDASDVGEAVAMGVAVLQASTTDATIKKAGKAVQITDEAKLSGYGDPVGEAASQLTKSIAAKVDNDCLAALLDAPLTYDGSAGVISYSGIVAALDKFDDENDAVEAVMFVAPEQLGTLRNDSHFYDKSTYGNDVMFSGEIGQIAGVRIVKSKKIVEDETDHTFSCPIVVTDARDPKQDGAVGQNPDYIEGDGTAPAITIYLKRNVQVETDRNILTAVDTIAANEHYVAVLSNDSKVVVATFAKNA